MSKSRINDVRIADSIDQLMHTNPRQHPFFTQQTTVGRSIEFDQRVQRGLVLAEPGKDSSAIAVLRWNQPVSVIDIQLRDRNLRSRHCPPRRASSSWRTCTIPGCPRWIMYDSGVAPRNIGFLFGSVTHASASCSL